MTSLPVWSPFRLAERTLRSEATRSLDTNEGIGDRLRIAAFAEIQAREAFRWAARRFNDAPLPLRRTWMSLSLAEDRHLGWLIQRMNELEISIEERSVSDQLWVSLQSCRTAEEFSIYMASAEDRGRKAGEKFYQVLVNRDPITAEIFRKIAEEEVAHIHLAARFYPTGWKSYVSREFPPFRSNPC